MTAWAVEAGEVRTGRLSMQPGRIAAFSNARWAALALRAVAAAGLLLGTAAAGAQTGAGVPLYDYQQGSEARWASGENLRAEKGAGGLENRGHKGHAFEGIPAGASLVLADIKGPGIIDRMWMTFADRSPAMLRALRLDVYYDGAPVPAVSVPIGDFFLHGAGEMVRMETELVSSPEGRSFVSIFPMPFRTGARVVIVNESAAELSPIYYDVDFRKLAKPIPDALYLHAYWSRDRATTLGQPFQVLPRVQGRGRFLGASMTVLTNPIYGRTWWGEGEVKIYLDGDRAAATLVGTGTEDYIGTAWGQGAYINRFQGAPIADDKTGRWSFYRFHIPDPIFFRSDIMMELQQIGGGPRPEVQKLIDAGVKLVPVSIDAGSRERFRKLMDTDPPTPPNAPGLFDGHTNFLRSDDVAAVAFFYLDRPTSGLPAIAPVAERTAALRPPPQP